MKRLAFNINKIVNKLYSTIPLVPSSALIENIYQDIQYGLYNSCGDPDTNWDKWKERCVQLLRERKIIGQKLASHDTDTRTCALIYIDGKIYEGESHNDALQQYLNDNNIDRVNSEEGYNRNYMNSELNKNNNLYNLPFACMHKIDEDDYQQLFMDYIDYEYGDYDEYMEEYPGDYIPQNAIFIETDTMKNVELDSIVNKLKEQYPNYTIYEDGYIEPFSFEQYNKVANKKVAYHDIGERDCAVLYIDNNFFENETHNEALTDYTNSINIRRRHNPYSSSREVFEDEFYNNRNLEDVDYCCLNKVTYDPIIREDVKRIFIDINTLKNIGLNELISKIQGQYPGFEIYIDNDNIGAHDIDKYEQVANKKSIAISRLKKKYSNKQYTWDEVVEITNNGGGRTYSSPFGDYSDLMFVEEIVDVSNITGYIPYDECQELDLDEDMAVVEYLADRYDDGEILPPVILDNQYKIIDGSHRVSMYDYLNIQKIKAFVLQK